jgi:hypothetical protein
MNRPFRKQVKIVRSPELDENTAISARRPRAGHRDTRPGRFTIKGSFIRLPDSNGATSDEKPA